jgi:hypothetical protein
VFVCVLCCQAVLCGVSFSGLPLLFVWGMLFNTLQRRADAPPMVRPQHIHTPPDIGHG